MSVEKTGGWEKFLNPQILKQKLISFSMYLSAYEMLKDSIIDRVKSVYVIPIEYKNSEDLKEYDREVLSRDPKKRPLQASLSWLLENDAIDNRDQDRFGQLTDCRNHIAHRMPKILSGELQNSHLSLLPELIALLRKIEIWWIKNFEIPGNSDFDNMKINEVDINPGIVITLQMMLEIALGSEEQ